MPDADPHAADTAPTQDGHHAAGDHDAGPRGGHGHAHEEPAEPLGPPDIVAWVHAVAGGAVGMVTALALYVASHR
jgi:hypothetical protein